LICKDQDCRSKRFIVTFGTILSISTNRLAVKRHSCLGNEEAL
jgi:hypothetical protein